MVPEEFSRSELLLGVGSTKALAGSRVALFGLGGVGSYVAEGLARSGVGAFVLVDGDVVSRTNLNRQLIALQNTVGRPKTEVTRERILAINPAANIQTHRVFYLPGEHQGLIDGCDYVVDAIDTVSAKLALVEEAKNKGIPIISCMGTGNKLDPTRFCTADIYETSVCPLCRVMRRELKKRGVQSLKVVYSQEEPLSCVAEDAAPGRHSPGSVSFVPPVAGMILAGEVVKDLLRRRGVKNL
jgi:tRNA A37 threonylcarbamoyladenosine dehydratase